MSASLKPQLFACFSPLLLAMMPLAFLLYHWMMYLSSHGCSQIDAPPARRETSPSWHAKMGWGEGVGGWWALAPWSLCPPCGAFLACWALPTPIGHACVVCFACLPALDIPFDQAPGISQCTSSMVLLGPQNSVSMTESKHTESVGGSSEAHHLLRNSAMDDSIGGS